MMSGIRVLSLFLGYGLIGFTADYAVGLWAQDIDAGQEYQYDYDVAVEVDVPNVVVEVEVEEVEVEEDVEVDVDVDVDVDVVPVLVNVQVRHGSCSYELDRTFTIPVSPANQLVINAGSGELRVEGRRGLDQIEVVGRVCASREEWLEQLTLSVETVGSDVILSAHYPNRNNRRGNNTAKIDLTVLMPLGMDVDIDDSSGSLEVIGAGNLGIEDSSGSVTISGVNGSVYLDDSSGGIEIQDVSGDVDVRDGSGGIDVRDVQGTVRLRDGSGGIDVAEVAEDVIVESDGSGSIRVRGVGGNFTVERDGSGEISHSDVRGTVDIPEKKRRKRRRGN